ncbi:hypothetical protein BGX24_003987 [Mortierella sp. AD032]|nr:hypothetical protein BGX24_003987 [Mortierella sp. AD032]
MEKEYTKPLGQTFYIDLSKSWTTSQPIYGELPTAAASKGPATALGNNKSSWYIFYARTGDKFNIQLGTWDTLDYKESFTREENLPAFLDPTTNQIYILDGYVTNNINGRKEVLGTMRFDTTASSSPWSNITQRAPVTGSFTTTWSTLKKCAFIFGGYTTDSTGALIVQKTMFTFTPGTGTPTEKSLSTASDSGDGPTARYDHCMVEAYNGTKMILFGGYDTSDTYYDDIYILDVASLKWSKGTPGGPTVARRRASCAVTNDLFVAWSGGIKDPVTSFMMAVSQNITIVYNLKTNQWQDTYSPDPYVPPPPTVTTPSKSGTGTGRGSNPTGTGTDTGSETTSGSSSRIGWIIGGVVGGLAVIGIVVALLFICCRRRRQANKDKGSPHVDLQVFTSSDIAGRAATNDNFYPNVVKGSSYTDPDALPNTKVTGRQTSKDNRYRNIVKDLQHTDPDIPPTMDATGRQANEDNFYHTVVKGSPHTDPGAFPNTKITKEDSFYHYIVKGSPHTDPNAFPNTNATGRQATEDNFYRNDIRGSPHTDPSVSPTVYARGRQVTRDDLYHNIVKGSPHTDFNALPTSNVADSTVLPRYNNYGNNPAGRFQSMTRNPRT